MDFEKPPHLRVGNAERERAVRALGEHFAQGRLDPEEYQERSANAYAARTTRDLDVLFSDLPTEQGAELSTAQRPDPQPPGAAPRMPQPLVPQPLAPQPGYDAEAPFGREPETGIPYSDKSKVAAGVLQVALGAFGIGRFYTGHVGIAVTQLLVTLLTFGFGYIWPLVDGILMLSGRPVDKYGRPLRP